MNYKRLALLLRSSHDNFAFVRKNVRSSVIDGTFAEPKALAALDEWDCNFLRKIRNWPGDITLARLARVFEFLDAYEKGIPYKKSSRARAGGSSRSRVVRWLI